MKRTLILLLSLLCAANVHATERSSAAKLAFVKIHACPATHKHKLPCPGYVIDHVRAAGLRRASDVPPANMQWQTIAAAKAKDKWERNGPECKHRTHGRKDA
jgi:hypothetical protein